MRKFLTKKKFKFDFLGMHKKSIEAAEALKSSDENSDKEDEKRSETSDTNSSNHLHRKTPTTPASNHATISASAKTSKATSNGSPSSSSISPATMSPPINNHHHPSITTTPSHEGSKKDYNLMSTPTSRAQNYHHGSPHEVNSSQHTPPMAHLPHPVTAAVAASVAAHHYPINPAPDTDAEVFRWVNYNRDIPVSFIR